MKRALDVGCAVGRSTFELARDFNEVVGIDYSNKFIQRCQELKMTGCSTYKLMTEGVLGEEKTATIHPDIVCYHNCMYGCIMPGICAGSYQSVVHGWRWLQSA